MAGAEAPYMASDQGGQLPPAGELPGASGAALETRFQPVRLGVRNGMEIPVRHPNTLRDGCALLTPVMDGVHRAISATHNNRKELRRAPEMSTMCSKLMALEESMPLGVVVLAESAKAQCDHQLQRKTAETVMTEATQKVRGH
jgi:hypothetical protein